MQIFLSILAGLGIILFLVALIMSHKSWKVHTLIMVFLIFSAASVAMWLSMQTLKTHQSWREILYGQPNDRAAGLIAKTGKLRQENQQLEFGKDAADGKILKPGIVQLYLELAKVLYDRGRMWIDCKPEAINETNDSVTVDVNRPSPSRIDSNLILYVFESRPFFDGGRYLGMFRVIQVTGNQGAEGDDSGDTDQADPTGQILVTILPNWKMTAAERGRLLESVRSGNPWTMYDKMPVDRHRVFADLKAADLGVAEEEFEKLDRGARLQKLISKSTLEEFIDDHQPAEPEHSLERIEERVEFQEDYPDDETEPRFAKKQEVWLPRVPPQGVVEIRDPVTNNLVEVQAIPTIDELVRLEIVERLEDVPPRYSRKLRDYGYLFRDLHLALEKQELKTSEVELDISEVEKVLADKRQVTARFEKEKQRLASDLKKFKHEQMIMDQLLAALKKQAENTGQQLVTIRNETILLGKRLDAAQMKAVEAINRRSPNPQSTTGAG